MYNNWCTSAHKTAETYLILSKNSWWYLDHTYLSTCQNRTRISPESWNLPSEEEYYKVPFRVPFIPQFIHQVILFFMLIPSSFMMDVPLLLPFTISTIHFTPQTSPLPTSHSTHEHFPSLSSSQPSLLILFQQSFSLGLLSPLSLHLALLKHPLTSYEFKPFCSWKYYSSKLLTYLSDRRSISFDRTQRSAFHLIVYVFHWRL